MDLNRPVYNILLIPSLHGIARVNPNAHSAIQRTDLGIAVSMQ